MDAQRLFKSTLARNKRVAFYSAWFLRARTRFRKEFILEEETRKGNRGKNFLNRRKFFWGIRVVCSLDLIGTVRKCDTEESLLSTKTQGEPNQTRIIESQPNACGQNNRTNLRTSKISFWSVLSYEVRNISIRNHLNVSKTCGTETDIRPGNTVVWKHLFLSFQT